ncbi:MAG: radical SAM protein [Chitinophagales bacterium]|nr:radical SAM protein [Chitinophagales bacterium]
MGKFLLLKQKPFSNLIHLGLKLNRKIKGFTTDYNYSKKENPSLTLEEVEKYNHHRKMGANKNICMATKVNMHFCVDGRVMACCYNKSHSIGNIREQTLHDIWFGKEKADFDKLVNDDYNLESGCYGCKLKIKSGDYASVVAQNYDFHSTKIKEYPTRMEFELHNTCNLECVMCNGDFSSSIRTNRENRPSLPFVYDDSFLDQLDEFIPHLQYADFIGGEPTLITFYYKIWEKIIEKNPGCLIHIQTNATTLKPRFKEQLRKGNFEVGLSIDCLNETLAKKIRKNIIWENFSENLQYYLDEYKKNVLKLTLNFCPMPANIDEVIPMVRFCNQHRIPIFFCTVLSPYECSFLCLNDTTLLQYIGKLEAHDLTSDDYYSKNNLKQLEDFIHLLKNYVQIKQQQKVQAASLLQGDITSLLMAYNILMNEKIIHPEKENICAQLTHYIDQKTQTFEPSVRQEMIIENYLYLAFIEPILVEDKDNYLHLAKHHINGFIQHESNKNIPVDI